MSLDEDRSGSNTFTVWYSITRTMIGKSKVISHAKLPGHWIFLVLAQLSFVVCERLVVSVFSIHGLEYVHVYTRTCTFVFHVILDHVLCWGLTRY